MKNVDPKTGQEYFRPKINKRKEEGVRRSPTKWERVDETVMERVGGGRSPGGADGEGGRTFGARLYERART